MKRTLTTPRRKCSATPWRRLLAAGALDVTIQPVLMKKNRPGHLLRVLATPALQEALAAIAFAETSTLGLRIYAAERRVKAAPNS